MSAKSALVLGVTGMVGEPLARALLEDGWLVKGAARCSSQEKREGLEAAGVEVIRFDMLRDDPGELPECDVLFLEVWDPHTCQSNEAEYVWTVNFYGVGRVVERYAGVADVVNGCTINVYGDGPSQPAEDAPCRPTSVYGQSRAAQENLINYFCYRGGRRGIHVRYAHSNTADRGVIRRMAETVLAGESLGANPDARLQTIGLEDFVRVTRAAADRVENPPTAVNCCHPHVWTQRELAEALRDGLGEGEVIFDRPTGGLDSSAYADASRMLSWFGEPQVDRRELVDRVVRKLTSEAGR